MTEMRLGDAGASVAVSLAAYGVMFGMDPFEAVEAAEGVLKAACVQHDVARGRKTTRMMGEVPVIEVMTAMGKIIDAQGPLRDVGDGQEALRAAYDVHDRLEGRDLDPGPTDGTAYVAAEEVQSDPVEGVSNWRPPEEEVQSDPVEGIVFETGDR